MSAISAPTSVSVTPGIGPVLVHDVDLAFGDRAVLRALDLSASPGERVGLVGENGIGKSTLLRLVAGELVPDAGTIARPADLLFLGQEPPFREDATVEDVLAATLAPLRHAVAEVERLGALIGDAPRLTDAVPDSEHDRLATEFARVLEWAQAHDAWDADRRALQAAARLGVDGLGQDRRIGTLSGGERTRLALATVMTRRPDALLLDEPTNHLDDDAIEVLEGFLTGLPGVVLLASHDRVLLDAVCTHLVDLDPTAYGTDGSGGRRFGGGWSAYLEHRRAARLRWEQAYAAQQEELDRLRAKAREGTEAVAHNRGPRDNDKFIYASKGQKVEATAARRGRDTSRRLADAEASQVRKPPKPLMLQADLTSAGKTGRVVQVRDLEVAGRLRLPRLDLDAGKHLLVTGPNGSGKSTLLGVLSGRVPPSSGRVDVAARTVSELAQDVTFADPQRTAAQVYADALSSALGAAAAERIPLSSLGILHPRFHATPVGLLSVGSRRRLGLALAVASGPDLLLLDEPTNHISLTLAGELEEAIGRCAGSVIVASHDRWLRRRWAGEHVAVISA